MTSRSAGGGGAGVERSARRRCGPTASAPKACSRERGEPIVACRRPPESASRTPDRSACRGTPARRRRSAPTATLRCRSTDARRDGRRTAAATKTRSATADGTSRSCVRRLRRSSRTRSNSRGSIRGLIARSASSARPRSAKRSSIVRPSSVASDPTSVSRLVPIRPSASWNSSALEIAAALIQQIAGDRGEPGPVGGIVRRARGQQQQRADHRHVAMLDGPHAQPVREPAADDLREA